MTQLSPAARATLRAYGGQVSGSAAITSYERRGIAAALRAQADQVVPEEPEPDQSAMPFSDWNLKTESRDARMAVRSELLAIAAELEGNRG